jgi:hypothetical protein
MSEHGGASWFSDFGARDISDDSHDVLDITHKNYRDLIQYDYLRLTRFRHNRITIFDFRVYLFARQVELLFKSGEVVSICKRAKVFITKFSRHLHEFDVSLTPFFSESWVYSACTSVISHCEEFLVDGNPSPAYQAAKSELMHFARMQLDTLGFVAQLIPFSVNTSPTIMRVRGNLPTGADGGIIGKESIEGISNEELKRCLGSKEAFDEMYKVFNRSSY